MKLAATRRIKEDLTMSTERQWIDPVGGLGDVLLISGVIKLAHDRLGKKYNMIRRSAYTEMLAGHPGIDRIDYLPKGAPVLNVDYGFREEFMGRRIRAFQMLAKIFGLELPAPETLYLPMDDVSDALLASAIPWRAKNVAIAPDSTSLRKMMARDKWEQVAKTLADSGVMVVQLGKAGAEKVKYTYSLAGVTNPKETILLLKRMDLLITADNYLMHAAHMTGTPTISLWGPSDPEIFGYPEHQKIMAPRPHASGKCHAGLYLSKCPETTPCVDAFKAAEIAETALEALFGYGSHKEIKNAA